MARKTRYWISAVYSLWCSVGFVYLIGWVIYQVIIGKQEQMDVISRSDIWVAFLEFLQGFHSTSQKDSRVESCGCKLIHHHIYRTGSQVSASCKEVGRP